MEAMKMTYREAGTVMLPNLRLPESQAPEIGKYGMERRAYLMAHRRGTYTTLLTENRLAEHLSGIDRTARDQVRLMTGQMAKDRGVNEQMKVENPIRWTQEMNSIKASAEETVRHQLIEA